MGFFDSVKSTLTAASQTTIQKGKEFADVARYNSLISEEEKKIANLHQQIGELYMQLHGEAVEPEFTDLLNLLNEEKVRLADYQQKLKDVKGVTKCTNCGAEVPNGSLFCASCGNKMETTPVEAPVVEETATCPSCGAKVPAGNSFCTACGQKLGGEQPIENVMEVQPAENTDEEQQF